MNPGDLLAIPLPDGRFGGAQILEVTPHAVALRLFGVIFDCAPEGPLDFQDAPVAIDHLAVAPGQVSGVVGHAPLPEDALAGGHALWVATGRSTVVDAPLAVLVGVMVAG